VTPPPKILVLGGGLSGLIAAWHLQRQGVEVEVWEAAASVGGWAQTLSWPGPQGEPGWLERGPQGLLVGRGSALDRLLRDLDLPLRPSAPKGPRWLGKGGKRVPSPTSLAGLLQAPELSLGAKLRMLAEPFIPAATVPDETLHTFFARRLGEGFAREVLPALVAGVLAAPPQRISMEALPRLRRLEARGGLLVGGLREGREHTHLPVGGTGALAQALASGLGSLLTLHPAHALEPLPRGRLRVWGDSIAREVDAVVVALPSVAAAHLLRPSVPAAAEFLEAIPRLDLRVWHSRHAMVAGWERGFGLLIHPPEGHGLLGADLDTWPGVFRELRRWLPELSDPVQTRLETAPGAFPLLEPGHGDRVARLLQVLPPNVHWLGADRFGPGIPDLAEGIEAWVQGWAP
jgi:oxygen-dependent protoporphyrinogen oxidase